MKKVNVAHESKRDPSLSKWRRRGRRDGADGSKKEVKKKVAEKEEEEEQEESSRMYSDPKTQSRITG